MSTKETDKPKILSPNLFPVVGIGASAGGLDAFKKLIKAIAPNSGMAYIFVQHLDPTHESVLPELLQRVTTIPIHEISDNIRVEPDHIYIIPSNKLLVATDGVLQLSPRPPKNQRSMPIDIFFSSLAEVHQAHAIGVVLSGTATDGTLGLKAIKENGGLTFAQDEASAAYDGMPHSAAAAGVVDFILPPEKIPQKLSEINKGINISDEDLKNLPQPEEDVYKQILTLLRIRKGTDFTYYKQTTIRRRILRRMAINKHHEPGTYLTELRENKTEQDILYQDLLIPVTSFFRDAPVFDYLCDTVFPAIVKSKTTTSGAVQPMRIWVAGCSTGQEAYSIAICFKEFLASSSLSFGEGRGEVESKGEVGSAALQIFATDMSEPAIAKARSGLYKKSEVEELSPQRLQEFFTKTDGHYQVNKSIRDMCVFAVHNFIKDPPFAKIDFLSCRNVLIYMENYLQKKALTTFHYSLLQHGFLLLGKSETITSVPELFATSAKGHKIFSRKGATGRFMTTATHSSEQNFRKTDSPEKLENTNNDFQKTADDILLSKYAPAGVVVNEAMDIVHFRGSTGAYLESAPGKPSINLLQMAKNDLAFELRNLLHKVMKEGKVILKENIPLSIAGTQRNIAIEAIPLTNTIEPHYLVLFHEEQPRAMSHEPRAKTTKLNPARGGTQLAAQNRIAQLENEIAQLREDMRSITQDQEAANEELQSANEELLSGTEELQSLNEEMETGKEELQSSNEELTIINQEMLNLNEQVTEAKKYSEAIVTTISQPLLVFDKNLRVKTANNAFYKTFSVNQAETEDKLIFELGNRQWNIPALRNLLENILPEKSKIENFEVTHNFLNIGERVMLLNAREMKMENGAEKLILLAIEDVTEVRKKATELLAVEKKYLSRFRNLLIKTPVGIVVFSGKNYVVELANDLSLGILIKDQSFIGKPLFETMPEVEEQMKPILDNVMQSGIAFYSNELPVTIFRNGKNETGFFNFVYEPVREEDETISGIITAVTEVTEQVVSRKKIQQSEERFQAAVAAVEGIIWTNNANGEMEGEQVGWSSITGQRYDEYQGFGWANAVHPDDAQPTIDAWNEAVIHRKNFVFEHRLKFKNGSWGHFSIKAIPLLNADGLITEWVGVHTDISKQKQSEDLTKASEAFNRTILESSPDCIKMLDAEGRVQFMNTNGVCLLEIDDFKKVKNTYWWDMWAPENRQTIKDAVAKAKSGEKIQMQLFSPTAKGTPKWWDIIVLPVEGEGTDTNHPRLLSVSRDITEQKQNELKEKELLGRFQTLVMQAPIAICVLRGKDYVIEVINEGMRKMWDRKIEEVINRPAFDVLPEFRDQGLKELLHTVYNTGERIVVQEHPLTIRRHERMENIFVQFVYEPLREADGTISGVMALAHEITEQVLSRKKIEESEAHFRLLADLMPVKISNANAGGDVTYFNKCWLEFSGYNFEDLKDFGYHKIMHPDEIEEFQKRFQQAAKTQTVLEMELRFLNKKGEYIWHLNLASPVLNDDGDIKMWVGVTTEIQQQKEQRDELELAVKERTQSLLEANHDLEHTMQNLEQFAYVASHDLQEPLRKIQTFATRLQQRNDNLVDAGVKADLARITTSADRMRQLINDLLEYSRLVNHSRSYIACNLNAIIDSVVVDFDLMIAQKNAVVNLKTLPVIEAIPLQMNQLFYNLIGNALKFSKEGEKPVINISAKKLTADQYNLYPTLKKGADCFDIEVTDNGIGFNPDFADQIFTIFQRLHDRAQYEGTGIGLAMCRKIVLNHGGEIYAESKEDQGASFHIILPVKQLLS